MTKLEVVIETSFKKVAAGLRHVASNGFQDYPPGLIELGVVLDALEMFKNDIVSFVSQETNEGEDQDSGCRIKLAQREPRQLELIG